MRKYAVKYTPRAEQDIDELFDIIMFGYANPTSAYSFIKRIRNTCAKLIYMPKISNVKLRHNGIDYRSIHVKNYTIFYHIIERGKTIVVDRIVFPPRHILPP